MCSQPAGADAELDRFWVKRLPANRMGTRRDRIPARLLAGRLLLALRAKPPVNPSGTGPRYVSKFRDKSGFFARARHGAGHANSLGEQLRAPARDVSSNAELEVHPPHAASRGHRWSSVFGALSHHGFGCDEQASDGGGILQRAAHDLGRVDHTLADEIAIGARLGVVAVGYLAFSRILPTTTEPSSPAFCTI